MKLPDVIQPQTIHPQIPPPNNGKSNSTSSASTKDSIMSATFSINIDTSPPCSDSENDPTATEVEVNPRPRSQSSSAIVRSIAVMKESDDPYRDSMLQMILEKGIYSREGLADLLWCFLELNSPFLPQGDHPGILRDMARHHLRSPEDESFQDHWVRWLLEVNAM